MTFGEIPSPEVLNSFSFLHSLSKNESDSLVIAAKPTWKGLGNDALFRKVSNDYHSIRKLPKAAE